MNQHRWQAAAALGQRLAAPGPALGLIVMLSLLVKVGYIVALGGGLNTFPAEGADSYFYARTGVVWWRYGEFSIEVPPEPLAAMPPGQSVLMALLLGPTDNAWWFAKLFHVG